MAKSSHTLVENKLGGSSGINFMFWTHASQKAVNNWGDLGNANWSWDALQPFYTKSEAYVGPTAQVQEDLQTQNINPALHGASGPIWNTFPNIYGPLDETWPRVYENLGLGVKSFPRNGLALGGVYEFDKHGSEWTQAKLRCYWVLFTSCKTAKSDSAH